PPHLVEVEGMPPPGEGRHHPKHAPLPGRVKGRRFLVMKDRAEPVHAPHVVHSVHGPSPRRAASGLQFIGREKFSCIHEAGGRPSHERAATLGTAGIPSPAAPHGEAMSVGAYRRTMSTPSLARLTRSRVRATAVDSRGVPLG